jgi:predicted exporter
LSGAVRRLARRRRAAAVVPLLFAAVAAIGVPQVDWQDDPGALSTPDSALVDEDRRVRSAASDLEMDRFVVVRGETPQVALARNDRVHGRMREAIAAGHLEGVRSLHAVLWSEELQRRNLESFRAQADLGAKIDTAYQAAGFRPGVFAGFARDVSSPSAPPLQPEDLADTPLAGLLGATLVSLNEGWGVITYLRGVQEPEAIGAALAGIEGAHYLDQGVLLREIFAGYRRSTLRLVGLGSGLVFAVLLLRYRRLERALLAFIPSALVALTTLGLFGLAGVPVNLLSVVSLILVMGMGVDYGVFVMDCARDPQRLAPTMLGLLVSCLTTIFVFGTLALSEHPALRSIGLTTGIGILLAFLAAPAVLALASDGEPS